MKSKILTIVLAVLIFQSAHAQTVPSYVPTNGLVGWWPFNGNANDESGNGNNGTVNGAMLTSDRFGDVNSAYSFDGTNDFIEVAHNTSLNLQGQYTISVWCNASTLLGAYNDEPSVVSKFNGWGNGGYTIFMGESVGAINYCYNASGNQRLYQVGFNSQTWYNIVIIYDGTKTQISVNDTILQTINVSGNILTNSNNLLFGRESVIRSTFSYFNGIIDDIGVWNRALTQEEITNLYNASLPTSIPIFNCPGAFISPQLANGLVGWWPFCGDADDESGNGNNGTVNGATLTSDRFGNVNSAYSFDGIGDSITVSNLPQCANYSFSGWFKADTLLTPYNVIFNQETSLENNRIQILGTGYTSPFIGTLFTGDDGNGNLHNSTYRVDDGIWHFATIVYDHQNSIMKMYIDGMLNGTSPIPVQSNFGGKTRFGNGFTQFINPPPYDSKGFVGILDDIGIWNRALDSSEVTQLYNTGLCTQTIVGSCDTLIFNANITGFNPVTYANQVKVYPNPASDNLVIDCGTNYTGLSGYSIRITNLLGQTVYNSPVTAQITNIQLTPPTWVNGTYVVQFVHPNGTVVDTKRIIIQ